MNRALAILGIEIGSALGDLRRGRALDGSGRARLIDILARCLMALTGRSVPTRTSADPAALVEAAIGVAITAGMSRTEVVATVNDALERN